MENSTKTEMEKQEIIFNERYKNNLEVTLHLLPHEKEKAKNGCCENFANYKLHSSGEEYFLWLNKVEILAKASLTSKHPIDISPLY